MPEPARAVEKAIPSVDEVMQRLRADGIDDLHKFVQHELASHASARAANVVADTTFANFGKPGRKPLRHKPPHMPIKIDGTLYDPKDIHRFDGQPLHFVGTDEGHLEAHTGNKWPEILRGHVNAITVIGTGPSDPHGGGAGGTAGHGGASYGPAEFFTDTNFGGDHLWLGAGRQFTDLTRVGRGDFWNRHTWNDCISSIKPVPYLGWLVLCWDTNLGGSTLTITITGDSGGANPLNGKDIPSLVPFGWNDQCSSIVYWSDGTTRG